MMYQFSIISIALFLAVPLLAQSPAVVLQDGAFASGVWVSKKLTDTAGNSSFTAVTESTGGNPGAYRHVKHMIQGGGETVSHLPLGGSLLSYVPSRQGAIVSLSYSYDLKLITGAVGLTYQLIVYQNGTTYAESLSDKTDGLIFWAGVQSAQRLAAGNFTKIDGPGPSNPDFSASGSMLTFGYLTSNPVPQSCSMYYGCYPDNSPHTFDTGIDNFTVNIFTAASIGASCSITPVNHFIPFHIPSLHLTEPDTYPNHTLKVLVTLNGAPMPGVQVNLKASQTALSTAPKAAPTLNSANAATGGDGQAVFYHNTPVAGGYSRTDFIAAGSIAANSFSCQSTLLTGVGTLTDGIQSFYRTSTATPANRRPVQVLAIRQMLLDNPKTANNLEVNPKYGSLISKILSPQNASWNSHDLRAFHGLLDQLVRSTDHKTRENLESMRASFHEWLANRRQLKQAGQQGDWDWLTHDRSSIAHPGNSPSSSAVRDQSLKLPLTFEQNRGQFDSRIQYAARGPGFNLLLSGEEVILNASPRADGSHKNSNTVRMKFPGGRSPRHVFALDEQPGKTNYLIGRDPAKWHTNVARYAGVKYEAIYPGIDLIFHGRQQDPEFDFVVAPGAHPEKIRIGFQGKTKLEPGGDGGLILHYSSGDVHFKKPTVYQERKGIRTTVEGRFVLNSETEAAFRLGEYDKTQPLVIDPVLSYASFLGGSDYDAGMAIAVDSLGAIYVAGVTCSLDFPTLNPIQSNLAGQGGLTDPADVFVAKFNPGGTSLAYSTYIGGSGPDFATAIAIDSQGSVYVTGSTASADFPLAHPFQSQFGGGATPADAFVLKLNPSGSALVYSTYLGGQNDDVGRAIAVDASGNAYVAGNTTSGNFPLKNALQPTNKGQGDIFTTKLNAAGSDLVYSTFLGGALLDLAQAVAADSSGNLYVAGITYSTDFPVQSAFEGTLGGGADAFVAKLNPSGSALVYSTYLGGSSDDFATGLAIDNTGNAYITGVTGSPGFPLQNPIQSKFGASDGYGADAFVTKLDSSGAKLVYSTFLGGKGTDTGLAIAVAPDGSALVAGETDSIDFPVVNGAQSLAGGTDGFLARLNPAGSQLVYSTPIGGSGNDSLAGIAVDSSGNIYLAGSTSSVDFPATYGGYQGESHGLIDALVIKVSDGTPAPQISTASAASFKIGAAASEAIVSGYGSNLASSSQSATTLPLPTTLGTTSVHVKDSAGIDQLAPLFFVSPTQINYLVPSGAATGLAAVSVVTGGQTVASGTVRIDSVAPGLFSANANGKGVATALSIQVAPDGTQQSQVVFQCGVTAGSCLPLPIDLGDGSSPVYLLLFGTGFRGRSDLTAVKLTIGGVDVPVSFAGAQGDAAGLDQVNAGPLPLSLAGKGELNVLLTVDGKQANGVSVAIK